MATDLISFKLLIHGYTLDTTFYQSFGDDVNKPGFAVQLFDFPTFIISIRERLSPDEIGIDKWIRFGNGKTTAFEMTDAQVQGFINDRPLIINFIDAEHQGVRVFSKTIVTLQSFRDNLKNYYHNDQENWKRRIFSMYDDMRNEVGKIDLSISLVKRRKDSFNPAITRTQTLVYPQQSLPVGPQNFPVYASKTSNAFKKDKQFERSMGEERPKTAGIEMMQQSLQESQYFPPRDIDNNKETLKNFQNNEGSVVTNPVTSLQTIVGGFYCPPVMLLQKKKKTVRFAGNENPKGSTSNAYPQQAKGGMSKSMNNGTQYVDTRSGFLGSTRISGGERPLYQTYGESQETAARPVVLLSNKESEKIVDLLKLKDTRDGNFTLLDLLLKELVELRSGSQPSNTIDGLAKAESMKLGMLRSKEVQKDSKVGVPKKRSSFGAKDLIEKKEKENSDQNMLNNLYSPKRNRLDSFKGLKGRDIVNEVIKETYEEVNQPEEEEYSQDFESMSVSQSLPYSMALNGKKDNAPASGKFKQPEKIDSIEESYPEDFDQLSGSHNFSNRYGNKFTVKTGGAKEEDSKDISEEIIKESGSGTLSNSQPYVRNYGKRESNKYMNDSALRSSKVFSDYSEDFEALSEENY